MARLDMMELANFFDDHFWSVVAVTAALVAAISMLADWRRHKRADLENVGFMPWTGIGIFAVLVTVLAIAFAIKSG
jgi:hypothetical protein